MAPPVLMAVNSFRVFMQKIRGRSLRMGSTAAVPVGCSLQCVYPFQKISVALSPRTRHIWLVFSLSFNQGILFLWAIAFVHRGLYTAETALMAAIRLLIAIITARFCIDICGRLDDGQFRRVLIWLMSPQVCW